MNMNASLSFDEIEWHKGVEYGRQLQAMNAKKIPKPIFLNGAELFNEHQPKQWLVEGFMEINSLNMLFGQPASGKSFIALDLAFHVAIGKPWHGYSVSSGNAIYITGEAIRGCKERVRACITHNNIEQLDNFNISNRVTSLYDDDEFACLQKELDQISESSDQPIRLIVIDTVARFLEGDENSSKDMGAFIRKVDFLKHKYDCTVLLVHHSGHGGGPRARGSSALKAALDSEFLITKSRNKSMKMSCTKMKDDEEPNDLNFEFKSVELPSNGKPVFAPVIQLCEPVSNTQIKNQSSHTKLPHGKNLNLLLKCLRALEEIHPNISLTILKANVVSEGMDAKRFSEALKGLMSHQLIYMSSDETQVSTKPYTN